MATSAEPTAGAAGEESRLIRFLRDLTETYGPSGREDAVRDYIRRQIEAWADEVRVDALGNLIARRAPRSAASRDTGGGAAAGGTPGRPRRVMVAAHMDEIALIATHIDDKGFIRVEPVGGQDPLVLLGQRVEFAGGVIGVVASEKLEDARDLKMGKLFVDIGASSGDEARRRVRVGDMAVFHRPLERAGNRLVAKAMDDRSGCAVVMEAMARLDDSPHEVFFVFTVQEEVGLRGARTAAYGIEPDVAVAVDITLAGDTPEPRYRVAVELGKGPAIKVKDNSQIAHPLVRRWMETAAEEHGIPYQWEVLPFGGTDAGAMQLARAGVPAGTLSIPTRYAHTPGEMVDAGDLEQAARLLVAMLQRPLPAAEA
ncbi:M42 family metallopeptidase [Thermaerobacter litoralis]